MKYHIRLLLFLLASGLYFQHSVQAQYQIKNSILGSGGAVIVDSSFQIIGTLGQPVVDKTSNASNQVHSGYWYQNLDIVTGVEQIPVRNLPKEFRLEQNYPNPFNPTTTIQFALPDRSQVTLKLYDLLGREVVTLVDKELRAGVHKVNFEADSLPSGVYFYRIEAQASSTGLGNRFIKTRKLMLLK